MSKPEVHFVKVDNQLKRRAERPPGLPLEALIEVAEKVVETHSASGREELVAAIADARGAIARWHVGGERAGLIAKLSKMAEEGQAQGSVLGKPLLSEVSVRLAAFVTLFAEAEKVSPGGKIATALALHLDAMLVALDTKAPAIDGPGQTLLTNLELTRRTIKAA